VKYPAVLDVSNVGTYPASAGAGGGFVWDAVLEYRVWCHSDGDDFYYAFANFEEALACSQCTSGAEEPLALILQREYISEKAPGHYVHVKTARYTEWPIEFLARPPRGVNTLRDFFASDAPANRVAILRGLAPS
jgi:hypothetical protein